MKRYSVRVPITGYLSIEIEAEDAEAAIEKALKTDVDTTKITELMVSRHIETEMYADAEEIAGVQEQ